LGQSKNNFAKCKVILSGQKPLPGIHDFSVYYIIFIVKIISDGTKLHTAADTEYQYSFRTVSVEQSVNGG
jgi:hypothetical protein